MLFDHYNSSPSPPIFLKGTFDCVLIKSYIINEIKNNGFVSCILNYPIKCCNQYVVPPKPDELIDFNVKFYLHTKNNIDEPIEVTSFDHLM